METPQVFESFDAVRKRSLISDRWLAPLKEKACEAEATIFTFLHNEHSNAHRASHVRSTVCVDESSAAGTDGKKPALYRCIGPGDNVLCLGPLPEYCLVVEAQGRHRHVAIVAQLWRQGDTFKQDKLRLMILLDKQFDPTMCDDPVWMDLLDRLRRVHKALVRRFAGG